MPGVRYRLRTYRHSTSLLNARNSFRPFARGHRNKIDGIYTKRLVRCKRTRSSHNAEAGRQVHRSQRGMADASCDSVESRNYQGNYLRHAEFRVRLNSNGSSGYSSPTRRSARSPQRMAV
ncbi:MAG: AbfB domain-containing protein [Bryobacteraceae bacterium]